MIHGKEKRKCTAHRVTKGSVYVSVLLLVTSLSRLGSNLSVLDPVRYL